MRKPQTLLAPALLAALLVGACVSVPKRDPLPPELTTEARVPGLPEARTWGDEVPDFLARRLQMSRDDLQKEFAAWFGQEQNYLAISGGGARGAFGAGLLVGWTQAGDRPQFQMVTGISTGALTAPFAFLGPEYDSVLEEIYTTYSTKDLLKKRHLINAFTSDAMYSTKPLEQLIARYVTEELVEELAEEARKGRRLLIGTTNLDAERPVVWLVGRIAATEHPDRVELIRKIILASASIPAAFPPVPFEVEAAGRRYDELHADGGATSQVFIYPAAIDWREVLDKFEAVGTPRVYVIRNSRLDPNAATVNRKLLPIASRSIGSLLRTQGIGDLYRILALSRRDGMDLELAYIPASFDEIPNEEFDPVWMGKLFDLGFELGKGGYPWEDGPPEFRFEDGDTN